MKKRYFSDMRVTIVYKKSEHNAVTHSESSLSRDRCVSRKRSIRVKSNYDYQSSTIVQILFERNLHADRHVNIDILPSETFHK